MTKKPSPKAAENLLAIAEDGIYEDFEDAMRTNSVGFNVGFMSAGLSAGVI